MPKKKTGARKKAEKQKERQRDIRGAYNAKDLAERFCNQLMVSQSMLNECDTLKYCLMLFACDN